MNGKVIEWNDQKGYGFISPVIGYERIFFHISALKNRNVRPKLNDEVSFEVSQDKKKRLNASNVVVTNARALPVTLLFSCSYLLFVAGSIFMLNASIWLIVVYIGLSMFTFLMYAWDKSAAQKSEWRTSEKTLHLLSLIGGWPGALVASSAKQRRHHYPRNI